jgi:hypothetical protein
MRRSAAGTRASVRRVNVRSLGFTMTALLAGCIARPITAPGAARAPGKVADAVDLSSFANQSLRAAGAVCDHCFFR